MTIFYHWFSGETMTLEKCRFFSHLIRKYFDCDGWKEGRWIYQLWKFS